MVSKFKYRQIIHYSLIGCTCLIQVILLVFFYNEYFNEKKLEKIKDQISQARSLREITKKSQSDLLTAQNYLHKYVVHRSEKDLEAYFESLQKLRLNLDEIATYQNQNELFDVNLLPEKTTLKELTYFDGLMDSVYKESKKVKSIELPFEVNELEIENEIQKPKVEIRHSYDTIEKKKFFPRLKDAIKGNVNVKTDTVFVNTTYENSIDTVLIKEKLDSTVNLVQDHYQKELKKYRSYISTLDKKNRKVFGVFEGLLNSGNNLMEVYDVAIDNFQSELENQFYQQNSKNEKIRRMTMLGLMLLIFIVLLILIFYTRQSFMLEKELKKANDQVNEHLRFKNRILGMLSHEIRSPLKIMNIFIDKIEHKSTDPKIIEYLKSMKFTNNSLILQSNQILGYTKDLNQSMQLQHTVFNLKLEINEILDAFQAYIESRNNQFIFENKINPEIWVNSDVIKIHQILINILGNANKFTENGEIKLQANSEFINPKFVKLKVRIEDTGVGISKHDLDKIFEPYYKGIVSDKVKNMGAGLGLNLCKELIELFGGQIKVESELGVGTLIDFEIKLELKNTEINE